VRNFDDNVLAVEIARVSRTGLPLSAMIADIDHFERICEVFGRAAGDRVLTHFEGLLRSHTRPTDIATRFGVEDFIVLMPDTMLTQAAEVAERIRILLALEYIELLPDKVTSSFGVAEYATGEDATTFLSRVDAAREKAKESGRNQVVSASA
jgi:diguanylate cyclase (GGDEF)-like protein